MSGVHEYSTTPASNTGLFPEQQLPGTVNDGMRQIQADIRGFYNEPGWIRYGTGSGLPTIAYASGTQFRVVGVDRRTDYHVGRRVKITGATTGTLLGVISGVAYASGDTTVSITPDSGTLANEALTVFLSAVRADQNMLPGWAARLDTSQFWTAVQTFLSGFTSKGDTTGELYVRGDRTTTGVVGRLKGQGLNDAVSPALLSYGTIDFSIVDRTAGSEDASIGAYTLVNGANVQQAEIQAGIRLGAATGGFLGTGTLNAQGLYLNGVALALALATVPSGAMLDYAGTSAPAGYLLCNGAAVSRTAYAALFTAIGTAWGGGDGSTTFNVPDFRGRVAVGAGTGTGLTARTLAAIGGAEAVTLTTAQLPAHGHPYQHSIQNGGSADPDGGFMTNTASALEESENTGLSATTSGQQIGATGGGQAHANMQPFAVATKIIKT